MYTLLTNNNGTYQLPRVGNPMRGNKGFTHPETGIQYGKDTFKWSPAQLFSIGIASILETAFDQTTLVSTGKSEALVGTQVVITHTTDLKDVSVLKTKRLNELSNYRKQVELGGMVYTTYAVDTSLQSQNKFAGATIHIDNRNNAQRKWTMLNAQGNKERVTLNKAAFKELAVLVGDHVDATYDAEEAHTAAINALSTPQEVVDYDFTADIVNSEWPSNPQSNP